jgi:tetratricopeptide (TPR) repeat protein
MFRTSSLCPLANRHISRYRFFMKHSKPLANTKSPFELGIFKASVLLFAVLLNATVAMGAQSPSSTPALVHDHLRKAEAYLKANDRSSAAKEFEAVLALNPKNVEAYANLGVIAFVQQDCATASGDFRKALAIDPSLVRIQALLGLCEKKMGKPSAQALLEKSFSKLTDKRLRLQVGMELASLYDEQGDSGGTASVMRALVDLDPDNVDVLFMAQRVYSELADDTLNKLAVLAPDSARMQQVIAERLVNGGDLTGAIQHYRKALQINPGLPGVHFELGEAILQSAPSDPGAQKEAESEFKAAVNVDGDTAKTECQFGDIAYSQSDLDGAFAHYQRAYQLNPNEVEAQMGLARILMTREKPQEAIKYLRMAVTRDPLNGGAHYRLAQAYRRAQMMDEAKKEAKLVEEIKTAKDRVEALYHEMNIPRRSTDEIPEEK